ncbi:hypothetical protein [Neisseria weaveri]|uniref:Uncharacterized protein n=1 Tax=Neisseria weaveri TaxID=28091 RepID=A0A448VPU8_9NEIS|nr:hypothetical protein [Neisseria weaveri]EGV35457.1 hypothetical protein l13_14740 [Neisseria weaveri ATCC 51223]EGV37795.1 hypothetical protein l11_10360 [Neisseria weaveri LMG 5135]SAY50426.1 Uncharacterised protein [Neisseria weaveri]VEJ51835.1 Uncharacterised protein [Neisseria weaveri]
MNKQKRFYDVYVSYPPNISKDRIDASIRENLSEKEAEDLIWALKERPQAIIAEHCTPEERENAQHYFSYIGLDVITRRSLEFAPEAEQELEEDNPKTLSQCPVCQTMLENPEATECPTCHEFIYALSEENIARKRIEWQEKLAFEARRQSEIAHKLQLEKEAEEQRLRKQIRAELEQKMREEQGGNLLSSALMPKKKNISGNITTILLMVAVFVISFIIARFL